MYRTTPISHDCSRSYPPQTVADCSCSDTVHSFTRNTATLFVRSLLTLPLRAKVHVSNLLVHFLFLFELFGFVVGRAGHLNVGQRNTRHWMADRNCHRSTGRDRLEGDDAGTGWLALAHEAHCQRGDESHHDRGGCGYQSTHRRETVTWEKRGEARASLQSGGTHRQQ